jgi:hypothetical protein
MRILIVLTSCERCSGLQRTGLRLESFVAGYYTCLDAGIDIVVCSPLGGPAPIAPEPVAERLWPGMMQRFAADTSAREVLSDALMLSQICPDDFCGIYYADGPGAVWDLVDDVYSKALIEKMLGLGHPCAFVGDGAAALLKIQDSEGRPLVANRRIAVSARDENAAQDTMSAGISLEREFANLGAIIVENAAPIRIVQDGNLITGLDTALSIEVAQALVLAAARES